MSREGKSLRRALRLWAERRVGRAGHPALEALAGYFDGVVAESEAELLREHLSVCPECADRVLQLADFHSLVVPGGAAAFKASERRPARPLLGAPRRGAWRVAAAVLAGVLLPLAGWLARSAVRTTSRVEPQATTVTLVELLPPTLRTSGGQGEILPEPRVDEPLALLLYTDPQLPEAAYLVRIREEQGPLELSLELAPSKLGSVSVLLSAGLPRRGSYAVLLMTRNGARTIETYRFEVGGN